MVFSIVAAALLGQMKPLSCAVMTDNPGNMSHAIEYAGTKYAFCCDGCPQAFTKDPAKYAHAAKATVGEFLFDPVTGEYVDREKSTLKSDYKGVRYSFNSDEDKAAFDKTPAKYTKVPAKEVLQCPISGQKLDSYAQAYGYVDNGGVRYYVCCNHCFPKAKADPAAAAKSEKGTPVAPGPINSKDAKPTIH